MRVGITGASGFIAGHLIPQLRAHGHECVAFSRDATKQIAGCSETRALGDGPPDLRGLEALVNLAGESIQGRWTAEKKRRIIASRVHLTEALVGALPGSEVRVLVSASATGFYGDRGDEILTETSGQGEGFLTEVSLAWEAAALAAQQHGVRVALPRIGFVLARDGGALDKLRPLFRLGLGGKLGSGKQWMPWVHVEDVAGLMVHLLEHEDLAGAFNAVAPQPVPNEEFTRALAASVQRPALFPVPAFALRLALGELAVLALASTRAIPRRTEAAGYSFTYPDLTSALRA